MANINWITVGMLVISNFIMLYAWYGHLRAFSSSPAWLVIVVSWLIALLEYCFAVPANRLGAKTMSVAQLKIIQEAISLIVFVPFSMLIMHETPSWNYALAAVCILAAVYFIFTAPTT